MALYKNLDYVEKRVLELEQEITDICLIGWTDSDSVWHFGPPSSDAYARVDAIRRELEDITDGENTILFTPDGVPEPMYVYTPKNGEEYLGAWTTYLENTGASKTGAKEIVPTFLNKGYKKRKLYFNKYKCSAIYSDDSNHTNLIYGMYNMAPAHSNGGFTVSYTGVTQKLDSLNAASLPPHFPSALKKYVHRKHLMTWSEYGWLCLKFASDLSFNPSGNTNYGADPSGRLASPAPYKTSNYNPHTMNGMGPREWRHNGKLTGIADLVGGCRGIISGVKIKNGIVMIIDFTQQEADSLSSADLADSSSLWKAISVADGSLIDPATIDGETVKAYCIDMLQELTASGTGSHQISDEILIRDGGYYDSMDNADVEFKEGLRKEWKIQFIGLVPFSDGIALVGRQYMRNADSAVFVLILWGSWYSGSDAGPRCVNGSNSFGNAGYSFGALLASDTQSLVELEGETGTQALSVASLSTETQAEAAVAKAEETKEEADNTSTEEVQDDASGSDTKAGETGVPAEG